MNLFLEKYVINERSILSRQRKALFCIIALIILFTNGFQYVNWNTTYAGWIEKIIYLCLALYFCMNHTKSRRFNFRGEIILLMFIPFVSVFNSWSMYSQPIYEGFISTISSFVWVIYFILPRYEIKESTILRIFLYVALFILVVQVVQQFTYPKALFGIRDSESLLNLGTTEMAEQRNGLWRFRMHQNAYFTVPILFAMWTWMQKKLDYKLLFLCALLFVSVYLTLTRQIMVACIFTIFISYFIGRRKLNLGAFIIGVLIIGGLYLFYDILFSALTEQTVNENVEDNIRILAATYFWNESISNPFVFLFGHGLASSDSAYGKHMFMLQQNFRFFTTDVGFIGRIYEMGIVYVAICYYVLFRIFFKMKRVIPAYIRMFAAFAGVMSPMIFPMTTSTTSLVWALLLYVCDLHINKFKNKNA